MAAHCHLCVPDPPMKALTKKRTSATKQQTTTQTLYAFYASLPVFNECEDPSSECLSSAVEKFLSCCLSLLVANLDEMHCRYFVDGLHVSPALTPKLVEALHRAGVLQGGLRGLDAALVPRPKQLSIGTSKHHQNIKTFRKGQRAVF